MTWLVTGGAGYIGAHVVRSLQTAGMGVAVVDDLSTGVAARVPADVHVEHLHIGDTARLTRLLNEVAAVGVIHLAAKKSVAESVERPDFYYHENVGGMLSLVEAMQRAGVGRLVYSSSAAVYGEPTTGSVTEDAPTVPISPYGQTKLIGEWIAANEGAARGLSWIGLRYFNVAGAGAPDLGDTSVTNLIPIALERHLSGDPVPVFGADYPTADGTCIRDYVHVADLAEAHVAAARRTMAGASADVVNIGTGRGGSVLEVLASLSRAVGGEVARRAVGRRAGDPAALVADVTRAREVLGWSSARTLDDMTASAVVARAVQR